MISFVKGFLAEQNAESIVVDVNGVGYEINMPPRDIPKLPGRGETVLLYTHLQVLENEFKLYGFMEKEELKLFKQLLGVSGMGAKGAINVLDFIDPPGFYQAIASQDEKLLIKIPGVGKKTASRLIFELKDKVASIIYETCYQLFFLIFIRLRLMINYCLLLKYTEGIYYPII